MKVHVASYGVVSRFQNVFILEFDDESHR
jgi:hypothetical protein